MKRLVLAQVLLVVLITCAVVVAPRVSPGDPLPTPQVPGVGGAVSTPPTARGDVEAVAPPAPTRTPEERDYPEGARSTHNPVFIEPVTATTRRARIGLSAWTAPGVPFDIREASGGVAFGLSIAWPARGDDAISRHPRP